MTTVNGNDPIDSRSDLYVVRPDGSSLRRLAINVDGWSFAWSPDGKTIAVSGANEHLYLASLDTARPIRAYGQSANWVTTDIAWSADGRYLAFARGQNTWDGSGDLSPRYLWIRNLLTGQQHRLREVTDSESIGGFEVTIAWLPGRNPRLAVFDNGRTNLLTPAGRTVRSITGSDELSAGSASPDGRNLVFVDGRSGSYLSAIVLASASGGPLRRITQTRAPLRRSAGT